MIKLNSIFSIEYGNHKINSKNSLDYGNTLVISSQGVNNGCYGFFQTKKKYNRPIITVPRTGTIGEAFVQLIPCNIDDNCLVLTPNIDMAIEYLFYIINKIRNEKWRYLYGRQITPFRIGNMKVIEPNSFSCNTIYDVLYKTVKPKKNKVKQLQFNTLKFKKFQITDLFNLERGHFHAIDQLKKGKYITISRVSENNGMVGFYNKPNGAKIFDENLITISTVTGDAFFQFSKFIATDNVIICIPKIQLKITTLIFIQASLNSIKWRYSYARQPYKRILEKSILFLPVNQSGDLDEDIISNLVTNTPYWKHMMSLLR